MPSTFIFEFEELPLVIHNGIEAAFINGAAEIEYFTRGDWGIKSVTVEGFGKSINNRRMWPQVPAPTWLALQIMYRLGHEWEHKVRDAVREQLADDREAALEDKADMRRNERDEQS